MFWVDQAAVSNQAHQATRRVRAAAKTEDVDFVASLVLLSEILVTLDDVELEAGAHGAADEAVVPFGANAFVVPFHLLGAVRRFIFYRFVKPAHIGFHPAVGRQRFVRRFTPGPVKTDDDSFHRYSLLMIFHRVWQFSSTLRPFVKNFREH